MSQSISNLCVRNQIGHTFIVIEMDRTQGVFVFDMKSTKDLIPNKTTSVQSISKTLCKFDVCQTIAIQCIQKEGQC